MQLAKMGIFLCDCGGSLKNIDFSKISGDLEKLEGVAFVDVSHSLCLEEGERTISSRILSEDIDRLVIAACSPELHERKFVTLVEKLGLNPNLLSWANIREQCSWSLEDDVTEKAKELIRMAIGKARLLRPVERRGVPVSRQVLIVGGGFSGMKLAIELSKLGLGTTIVERESILGGKLNEAEGFYGLEIGPRRMLSLMMTAIEEDKNVEVLTSAEVRGVRGEVGGFEVTMKRAGEEHSRGFGAIVFATGYRTEILAQNSEIRPGVNVISHLDLVEMLRAPERLERRPSIIGFILDVCDENSRLPTISALNNALAVRDKLGSEVYVFCRNLKVDSEGVEELYGEARERGVVFVKFDEAPQMHCDDGQVVIEARDVLLGEEVVLRCDFLVADERALPSEGTKALGSMLNVGSDSQGFYQDGNVHLYPVASARKGVFFVGGCRGNMDLARASNDIASAVMSIYALLGPGETVIEVEKVKVDRDKCRACLTCIRACPHGAIQLLRLSADKEAAQISDLACDGCGICAAVCPAKAISFEGYSDEQMLAELETIGK